MRKKLFYFLFSLAVTIFLFLQYNDVFKSKKENFVRKKEIVLPELNDRDEFGILMEYLKGIIIRNHCFDSLSMNQNNDITV